MLVATLPVRRGEVNELRNQRASSSERARSKAWASFGPQIMAAGRGQKERERATKHIHKKEPQTKTKMKHA